MLATLLAWLTGGGLAAIGKEINRAYQAKLDAKNDAERIEAEKQIAVLEARQAVLIAEQGNWLTRWIRPAFAFPFVVYDAKIVVWDKVLGLGVTDPMPPEFWHLHMVIVGAYFLTRPFEKRR